MIDNLTDCEECRLFATTGIGDKVSKVCEHPEFSIALFRCDVCGALYEMSPSRVHIISKEMAESEYGYHEGEEDGDCLGKSR